MSFNRSESYKKRQKTAPLEKLLENNKKWAARITAEDPNFFHNLAKQQHPEILWIGCSDSRVPANQVIDLLPGEVFVHRNIANCIIHTDFNSLSVISYAVDVLKVKHIIVCGHYGCGGIQAAMGTEELGLIDNWLRHIKDTYEKHKDFIEKIPKGQKRFDAMVELNVLTAVQNICHNTILQNAWARGQQTEVHGWCYSIEDGLIKDLTIHFHNAEDFDEIYHYKTTAAPPTGHH